MSLRGRSSLLIVLLFALPVALGAAPARAAAARAADTGSDAWSPRIEAVTATGYRVTLSIPEPGILTQNVFGQRLAEITLPGGSFDAPAGAPQLPRLVFSLRVPWGVAPSVRALPGAERTFGPVLPVPLPNLVSARGSWPTVTATGIASYLEGPEYRRFRGGSPAGPPLLTSMESSALGERVLNVTLRPVAWDPATGLLRSYDRVTFDVSWDRAVPVAAPPVAPASGGSVGTIGPRYARLAPRSPAPRAEGFRSFASAYSGPFRVEPTRPWVRLGIFRQGLYAVSAADLALAGITVSSIDPATFRIFRSAPGDLPESTMVDQAPDSLRECAIVVSGEGDGTFDSGDRIYFYATGSTGFGYDLMKGGSSNYQEAQFSDEEGVWLTWGPGSFAGPPRRMATRDATPPPAAPATIAAIHRVHYEENRVRDFNSFATNTRWERWFYRLMTQGSRIAFPLTLPGAMPGGTGSIFLRMWGKGISVGSAFADHYTNLYWDGALVASGSWSFSTPKDIVGSGFTVHAADTLQVEIPRVVDPQDPNRFDQSELAWFEVTYPRQLLAINDTLQFAADSTFGGAVSYFVQGVSDTTAVWFLERSDPENPVRYVNGVFGGPAPTFTLNVGDSLAPGPPKRYSLVSTARAARPASVARFAPLASAHTLDNLLDPAVGLDYVIVAHPTLLASAESLAIYRAGNLSGILSPRVGIATTDRIGAQFGGRYLEPVAMRNFLAYARQSWSAPAPTYVCLFGDASLDPKNYLGFATPDLVPTYGNYYDTSREFQHISDDFFGFLDGPGDQLLDMAIGRISVKTPLEGSLVRAKIQAYEGSTEFDPWRARALLCADDSRKKAEFDILGNEHVREMERKDRLHLPYPIERSKVYLNDYAFADTLRQSKPAAREDFIARINQGNWFVDYIGHGSDLVLADEQVFRAADVSRLTNLGRPGLFGFFSCTVGKFDALGQEGLAELLIKNPTGGAVASLAATELVIPTQSTELNDSFVDRLFPFSPRVDSTLTIGLAWAQAKNDNVNFVVRKYVLLGDPGLRPPIPKGRGVWEKAPLDSVLRGDLVVVRGHALNPDSSADVVSNGSVKVQVQGKPFERTQIGPNNLNLPDTIHYFVPGPILFRGDVPLVNGSFEARFVVPMDVRVAGGTGQLRGLLSQAGGRGVGLAVDSLKIGQGVSSRTDGTPPTITLFHAPGADSTFQPGDLLTFVIEDSSGIDLTRLDNAHAIFAILDDRGSPYDLTGTFAYESGSYTRGAATLVLPQLNEGLHSIEVHASDTFGNIAVRTFVLDIHAPAQPGDPMRLSQVFNYPNPFEGVTYIHARLNQTGRIRVGIYTVAGRRVRDLSLDGRAGENYLPWDGKDSEGENVAVGVYLLKVTAESSDGKTASAVGRALRKR